MSACIQLSLAGASPCLQNYVFTEPQTCTIGRASDCTIVLPSTAEYADVSRHHCVLRIDPPVVAVRDLNSMNGTFVNDNRIESNRPAQKGDSPEAEWISLHDGDSLRLAKHAVLLLDIREFAGVQTKKHAVAAGQDLESGTYVACPD